MKHKVKAFVVHYTSAYSGDVTVMLTQYEMKGNGFATIREQEFEIEIDDDFNPIPTLIADMEEQKRVIRLKAGAELAKIDESISKLSALTFETA